MKQLYTLLILLISFVGFGQGEVNCSLLEVTDVVINNTNLTIDIAVYNGDTMDSHYPFIAYTIDALGDTIQSGNIDLFVTFASDTSWYSYMILTPIIPVYPLSIYFVYSNLIGTNPGDYTCILTYNIDPTGISDINLGEKRKLQKTVDILGKETKPKTNTPFFYIYDDGSVEKKVIIE